MFKAPFFSDLRLVLIKSSYVQVVVKKINLAVAKKQGLPL